MINTNGILPPSNFTKYFLKLNKISFSSFKKWHIKPGMDFRDTTFWWGNHKQRKILHEGIDLHCYLDNFNNCIKLSETIQVPVIFKGQIVQIFNDFKGKTVHIIHDIYRNKSDRLHSLYGHTQPLKIINNSYVDDGSVFALIAAATNINDKIPLHLHLTIFWAPKYIVKHDISWEYINSSRELELINPLPIIYNL